MPNLGEPLSLVAHLAVLLFSNSLPRFAEIRHRCHYNEEVVPQRLIYLHGFASSPNSRKAQFFRDRFAGEGFAVDVPALDGGDFFHLTITGQLALVEQLAQPALARGEKVTLMGSSLGGYLAALFAARNPQVAGLILLAPAFAFARRWPLSLPPEVMESWQRTGSREVFHYGDGLPRPIAYGLLEDGLRYEDFPAVPQRALVLHGRQDPVVPASFAEEFAAKNAVPPRLVLFDAGHELTEVLEPIWQECRAYCQLP